MLQGADNYNMSIFGSLSRCLLLVVTVLLTWSGCFAAQLLVGRDGSYPYSTITEALNHAANGDVILVADGNYTYANGESFPLIMKAGVVLRAMSLDKKPIIDAMQRQRVIECININQRFPTLIEGFVITGGFAQGVSPEDSRGAGIYLLDCNLTIANCIIKSCLSNGEGGGLYAQSSSSRLLEVSIINNISQLVGGGMFLVDSNMVIADCVIEENFAHRQGGGIYMQRSNPLICRSSISFNNSLNNGAGIYLSLSNPRIKDSRVISNNSDSQGGGFFAHLSNMQIYDSLLEGNRSVWHGGCGYLASSTGRLVNCIMVKNRALLGGLFFLDDSAPTIQNCTITLNHADSGGGALQCHQSNPVVTNSILWNDEPLEIYITSGNPLVTYSNIQGGYMGEGNINANPYFRDPLGDFHLQMNSECIDAGRVIADLNHDFDHLPRPDNQSGMFDMGAYENPQLTPTPTASPTAIPSSTPTATFTSTATSTPSATPNQPPKILVAGYMATRLREQNPGRIELLAYASDAEGYEIKGVEIYYQGGATGIMLPYSGQGVFYLSIDGLLFDRAQSLLLELRAMDAGGTLSNSFPYLTAGE